jgi:hypothetical protein
LCCVGRSGSEGDDSDGVADVPAVEGEVDAGLVDPLGGGVVAGVGLPEMVGLVAWIAMPL